MSLYNMLFGVNPAAQVILAILGLKPTDIPRFRDCYVENDETAGYRICVHTRTGGGNRDYYEDEATCRDSYPEYFEAGKEAPAGPWNAGLRANPHYISDADDSFDSTYANFYFRLPEKWKAVLEALDAGAPKA